MEKRRSFAQWIIDRGASSVALIGGVGIYFIAIAVVCDVLMRWLFNSPILGVDDLSIYILAVVVSSFFPAGLAEEKFVTIRFLGKSLGPKGAAWLEVFGAFCTLFFFILLAWKMSHYAIHVTSSGLGTIVLQLPQAPWWWLVTIVMILCVPIQIIMLYRKLRSAISGKPSSPEKKDPVEAS